MSSKSIIIDSLKSSLPPVFSREEASKCLGGLLCAKTFSNLDAAGLGPTIKIRFGKKIAYEKNSFLEWLDDYIEKK